MVRFSVGGEEEAIVIRGNKRRNQAIEDGNQRKLQRFAEDNEEYRGIESKGAIFVTIDPDVLECFICCEPLRPPLYQCQNGHVACSLCSTKLPQNKCPTCSHSINSTRCRALEKVIESTKSSCSYSKYSCPETLPYLDISSHQENCTYAPCFCPIPNCTFCGFPELVSSHFSACHGDSEIKFQYEENFEVLLGRLKPFVVLHEGNGLLFLLLNETVVGLGNALSVACINRISITCDFVYELTVSCAKSSLQLKASAENIRKWVGVYAGEVFLLVPENFSSCDKIVVNICIQRKKTGSSESVVMN